MRWPPRSSSHFRTPFFTLEYAESSCFHEDKPIGPQYCPCDVQQAHCFTRPPLHSWNSHGPLTSKKQESALAATWSSPQGLQQMQGWECLYVRPRSVFPINAPKSKPCKLVMGPLNAMHLGVVVTSQWWAHSIPLCRCECLCRVCLLEMPRHAGLALVLHGLGMVLCDRRHVLMWPLWAVATMLLRRMPSA